MAQSTIKITFLRDALDSENILFEVFNLDTGDFYKLVTETWFDGPRQSLNTVQTVVSTVPQDVLPAGGTVKKYDESTTLDYGTAMFLKSINGNEITFTAIQRPGINIRFGFRNFACNTGADIFATATIVNDQPNPMYVISETFGTDASPCNNVLLTAQTSVLATEIIVNGTTIPNAVNPALISLKRAINNSVVYGDGAGNYYTSNLNPIYYGSLSPNNVKIDVVTNISGATSTISITNAQNLSLQYNIDGGTWKASNVFTGMATGSYTAGIKDQFGCEIFIPFEVVTGGTKEPFVFVSKANSLNFILQEETSSCGTPKNDDNTFASQNLALLPACTETLLQTCDTITSQFKSNFDSQEVKLISKDGGEVTIPVDKMSSNMNNFEAMDCTMYEYGDNQTGIYFTEGQLYQEFFVPYVPEKTYALNGNLPDFAILGNFIELDGIGTFEIMSVLFDDRQSVRKKVIVINRQYIETDPETPAKIASYYDLLPYEIYQFTIDWSQYEVGFYSVELKNIDVQNGTLTYISEDINLAVEHPDTLRIDYYNSNNRDIFYKYGIEHRIRVPFISIQAVPNDTQDISLTDNGAYVVDSIIYEADQIIFDYMVKSMMRKVTIALGCQHVFVNGVGYVGESAIEFEQIGQTNVYTVSKTMVKSNVSYSTRHTGNSGQSSDYVNFNIPALIAYGTGMIKQ